MLDWKHLSVKKNWVNKPILEFMRFLLTTYCYLWSESSNSEYFISVINFKFESLFPNPHIVFLLQEEFSWEFPLFLQNSTNVSHFYLTGYYQGEHYRNNCVMRTNKYRNFFSVSLRVSYFFRSFMRINVF